MPTPVPPDRLPRLKEALERYGPHDMESQHVLAELYGVAPSRMVTLIKSRFGKEFPPADRHPDKTFWYNARKAIECMIAYTEGTGADKRAAAARAAAVLAGETPASGTGAAAAPGGRQWPEGFLTPQEMDRLASAQTRIWRLRKEQGLYVLRSDVEDMVRQWFSLVSQRIVNIPGVIDANGKLPPAERQALQRECREIVLALHRDTERLIDHADGGHSGTAGAADGIGEHQKRTRARRRPRNIPPAA